MYQPLTLLALLGCVDRAQVAAIGGFRWYVAAARGELRPFHALTSFEFAHTLPLFHSHLCLAHLFVLTLNACTYINWAENYRKTQRIGTPGYLRMWRPRISRLLSTLGLLALTTSPTALAANGGSFCGTVSILFVNFEIFLIKLYP